VVADCPERDLPAPSYGERWNRWEAPIVDTAVIENNGGDLERLGPGEDGWYDRGNLGWTFVRAVPDDAAVCDRCGEGLTLEQAWDGYCPSCDDE